MSSSLSTTIMFGPEIGQQLLRLERQIADMECRAMTNEAETIEQLKADLELRQVQVERTAVEAQTIRADRDTFRSEVTVLTAQLELLKDKLDETQRDKEKLLAQIATHGEQMHAMKREAESLEGAVLELRREKEAMMAELTQWRAAAAGGNSGSSSNGVAKPTALAPGGSSVLNRAEQERRLLAELKEEQDERSAAKSSAVSVRNADLQRLMNDSRQQKKRIETASPQHLSQKKLNMLQNAISDESRKSSMRSAHEAFKKQQQLQQSAAVAGAGGAQSRREAPVEPSPWEAFAVLRNALDREEQKLQQHQIVPAARRH